MSILFGIHSWFRWLILLLALIALIKFLLGWLRGSEYRAMDRGLMSGFSGLMDLQATLGIGLLLWAGFSGNGFPANRLVHGGIMILAVVVAHLSVRWKNAASRLRFRNSLLLILGSLILGFLGIAVLSRA